MIWRHFVPCAAPENASGLLLVLAAPLLEKKRDVRVGPSWIEIEGRVSYDVAVLLEYIRKNTRMPSVRAMQEDTRGVA